MQSNVTHNAIEEVLDDVYPDAREILGDEMIDDLIRGETEFVELNDCDTIDPTQVIVSATAVIQMTIALLQAREAWLKTHLRSIPDGQLRLCLSEKMGELRGDTKITVEQGDRIIDVIIKRDS